MAKQDLRAKTIQELRKMAKRKGIAARREWKKEDFVKALSPQKKSASRPLKSVKRKSAKKTVAGKATVSKTVKKTAIRRTAKSAPPKRPAAVSTPTVSRPGMQTKKRTVVAGRPVPPSARPRRELLPPLPAEYDDDRIVTMPVTPGRLYVYWEIPQDRLAEVKGSLNLRAHDMKTNSFFYTPVSDRVGESFININPGSNYSIEIGIINNEGEFVNVSQPGAAAAPEGLTGAPERLDEPHDFSEAPQSPEMTEPPQERALPEEFFETPGPVSSY